MSQLNVEEMMAWSRAECEARLDDVLPKLVEIISDESDDASKSLQALKLLCQNFLPASSIESFEMLVLCKVLPHVERIFGSISQTIKLQIISTDLKSADEFEQLFTIFDCLELCLRNCIVITTQEIALEHISSLPSPVLKIAVQSFKLFGECKVDAFETTHKNLSEQLDCLFNRTTSMIKSFLSLWEKLKINVSAENDAQLTVEVCSLLNDVCRIFSMVAGKSPIALWKVYVNTLVKYCDGIKDRVDVASTIELLCENVQQSLREITTLVVQTNNLDKDQQASVVRLLQICGFCLKIIMTLCEKFKFYLGDCFHPLLILILKIYEFCPPGLSRPKLPTHVEKEVERNLSIVIDPLLSHLLLEPQFISSLKAKNWKVDPESDYQFSACLLQLYIIENIFQLSNESQELLQLSEDTSLFHSFFDAFSKCSIELSWPVRFPGVMCNGKPQRMVSFYEHICARFCGVVAVLSAAYFPLLEQVLVYQLMSGKLWNSLLVCDVWTFLGRLESPQLCFHHCCCIADMVSLDLPGDFSSMFTALLLKRLYNLLATDHKMQFLNQYPLSRYHRVWCHLYALQMWGNTYDMRHLEIIASSILDQLDSFLRETSCGIQASDKLLQTTRCLHSLSQIACLSQIKPLEIGRKIKNICLLLWKFSPFHLLKKKADSESEAFTAHLIVLTSCLCPIFDNKELVEIQRRLLYIQSYGSQAIKLAVFKIVHQFALKTIPPISEQAQIFKNCAMLLSICLDDSNAILAQKGLETFADFSYITNHETIVARCLQMKPQARETVKQFLNKVAGKLPSKYQDSPSVLRTQMKMLDSKVSESMGGVEQSITLQPLPENVRDIQVNKTDPLKNNSKDEIIAREVLEHLEISIARLDAAVEAFKPQIPDWLIVKIQFMMNKLDNVTRM